MKSKKHLVFIPGLLLTADLWHNQVLDLAEVADISVADHTGHDSVAATAAAILRQAPARFALAGLSFGGYVAFEIMRQAPERVERLALLDTSARTDGPEQAQRRRDFIALVQRGRFLGVTDDLIRSFVHPDRHADADLMGLIRTMAQEVGPRAFVRQEKAILSRPDSRAGLAAIACPTLVLCGGQDTLTPPHLHEEIAAGIAGSRLAIIENCGHLPPLERPDEVSEALRAWLL